MPKPFKSLRPQIVRQVREQVLAMPCPIFAGLFELDKVSADQPVAQNQCLVNCLCCPAKASIGGGINGRDELLVVHELLMDLCPKSKLSMHIVESKKSTAIFLFTRRNPEIEKPGVPLACDGVMVIWKVSGDRVFPKKKRSGRHPI